MAVINDRSQLDMPQKTEAHPQKVLADGELPALLDPTGRLLIKGKTTAPPATFVRSALPTWRRLFNLREFDSCLVSGSGIHIIITVGETGLCGFVHIALLFEGSSAPISHVYKFPLSFGQMDMPQAPERGDIILRRKDIDLDVNHAPDKRYIRCRVENFDDVRQLYINLLFEDSVNSALYVTRTNENQNGGFSYSARYPASPVSGTVVIGADRYELNPAGSFANYHWLRGVLPSEYEQKTFFMSGRVDGKTLGVTVSSEGTYISIGGASAMLEPCPLRFRREEPLKPLSIRTHDHRLSINFTPQKLQYEKRAFFISAERQVVFGKASGVYYDENGEPIQLPESYGFITSTAAKW